MTTKVAITILIASMLLAALAVAGVMVGLVGFFGLGGVALAIAGAGVVAVNVFA